MKAPIQQLQEALACTQEQYQQTQAQLQQVQLELQQARDQHQQTLAALQQAQFEFQHLQNNHQETQTQLKQSRSQIQNLRANLKKVRENKLRRLQSLRLRLQEAERNIEAMEASKFWKLRTIWIKLKRTLKLTDEADQPSQPLPIISVPSNQPDWANSQAVPLLEKNNREQRTRNKVELAATQSDILKTNKVVTRINGEHQEDQFLHTRVGSLIDRHHLHDITRRVTPFTVVGQERMESLYHLSKQIEDENIPGDVIECGVRSGGTAAILAHFASNSRKFDRTVWLFDSFEGMPMTTIEDGEEAKKYIGKEVGEIEHVLTVLNLVNADMTRVKIVEGWFEDTFPKVSIQQIALLNIDADWYASVKLCLETFFDAVVPGGFISFDDYGHWAGCKQAVDEFFRERNLSYKLHEVDYTARWIQKL